MPCFGSDPQCNMCTRFSSVGFVGHIVNPLNRAWILTILLVLAYLVARSHLWFYGPVHALSALPALFSVTQKKLWNAYIDETMQSLTLFRTTERRKFKIRYKTNYLGREAGPTWSWWDLWIWYDDEATVRQGIMQRDWKSAPQYKENAKPPSWLSRVYKDACLAARVPRCQRAMLSMLFTCVLISDTEKTVAMNLTASRNGWGYGQIFALVATIPSVAAVGSVILRIGHQPV